MNLAEIAAAVVRRWYIAVVILGLTGYSAAAAWSSATPIYTSTTMLAVIPSPSFMQVRAATGTGESSLGNPFGFTAAPTLASLLADSINYGGVDLPPEADGARLSVDSAGDRSPSYITVSAVGRTPESVVAALTSLDEAAPAALITIQAAAGAPSDQVFTAFRTRGISTPDEQFPNRQRSALGIGLVGLLVTALSCVAVDSWMRRSKERRARSRAQTRGTEVETEAALPESVTLSTR